MDVNRCPVFPANNLSARPSVLSLGTGREYAAYLLACIVAGLRAENMLNAEAGNVFAIEASLYALYTILP
jgi:hypothetical protein